MERIGHPELDTFSLIEPLYQPLSLSFSSVSTPMERRPNSIPLLPEKIDLSPRYVDDALRVLEKTSRTFYIPITRLPGELKQAATSAYLCLRALDEIEDHPKLDRDIKTKLLDEAYVIMLSQVSEELGLDPDTDLDFDKIFCPYQKELPEVTLRIEKWLSYSPKRYKPWIHHYTMVMAEHMRYWVERNWEIRNECDLDIYTFDVAGVVGFLLNDMWFWYSGTKIDSAPAGSNFSIQYGQCLQAVNILNNREEDLKRGVDFFPHGWEQKDMLAYAKKRMNWVKGRVNSVPKDAFACFFEIPLALAEATLDALENRKIKLTRSEVQQIISRLDEQKK